MSKEEKIVSFRGADILQSEAKALRKIETLTKGFFAPYHRHLLSFTKVNDITNITNIMGTKMSFSASNNKVTGIGLYGCGLTTLSESLVNLKSLQILDLKDNRLTTLPESLGQLSSLEELDLRNNFI